MNEEKQKSQGAPPPPPRSAAAPPPPPKVGNMQQSSGGSNVAISNSTDNASNLPPYWQQQFGKIDEVGLQAYKKFNWPAFFFTWIWAFTKGLWQNALVTLGLVIGGNIIFDALAVALQSPGISMGNLGLQIGIAIFYGTNGNKWYYRKTVKKETVIY